MRSLGVFFRRLFPSIGRHRQDMTRFPRDVGFLWHCGDDDSHSHDERPPSAVGHRGGSRPWQIGLSAGRYCGLAESPGAKMVHGRTRNLAVAPSPLCVPRNGRTRHWWGAAPSPPWCPNCERIQHWWAAAEMRLSTFWASPLQAAVGGVQLPQWSYSSQQDHSLHKRCPVVSRDVQSLQSLQGNPMRDTLQPGRAGLSRKQRHALYALKNIYSLTCQEKGGPSTSAARGRCSWYAGP